MTIVTVEEAESQIAELLARVSQGEGLVLWKMVKLWQKFRRQN